MTGDTGIASRDVPAGSSVTVYSPKTSTRGAIFSTVMGVGPGDTVPFSFSEAQRKDTQIGALAYTGDAGDAGLEYGAAVCGALTSLPAPPGSMTDVFPTCRDKAGNAIVLYAAKAPSSPRVYAWATRTAPWSATQPSPPMLMGNSSDWQAAPAPNKLTVSGTMPDAGGNVGISIGFAHDRVRFDDFGSTGTNSLPVDVPFIVPPPATFQFLDRQISLSGGGGARAELKRIASAATDITASIDDLLPAVTSVAIGGTLDAPTMTYGGSFASAQGVVGVIFAEPPDAGENDGVFWQVRSFGTSGTLTFPKLPAASLARVPAAGWSQGGVIVVAHDGAATAKAFATSGFVMDARGVTTANFALPESPVTIKTSRRGTN